MENETQTTQVITQQVKKTNYFKWCTFLIWIVPFLLFKAFKWLHKVNLLAWLVFCAIDSWVSIIVYDMTKYGKKLAEVYIFGLQRWIVLLILSILLITIGLVIVLKASRRKDIINK